MRRLIVPALAGVALAVGLVALLAACAGSLGTQPTGQASPAVSPSGPVVLTLVGEKGEKQFTLNQLEALPAYTGYAGIKSSTGVVTLPAEYTGVRLSDLTNMVGGITKTNGVTLVAKDGYGMTFSYNMIMDHAFTAYDPATGAATDGCQGTGPVVLAVDNLPAELPWEASCDFSAALMPFVPEIAKADTAAALDACGFSEPVRKATILYQGRLTPGYRYLEKHLS